MWIMWIMWIIKLKIRESASYVYFANVEKGKRNPQNYLYINVYNTVDNVDNYLFINEFPIESTFPAPIVINRSFFLHFLRINFSISSKF